MHKALLDPKKVPAKTKNSYLLSFQDNWGPKFCSKIHILAFFGHKMGLKSLENAVFGFAACQNIGMDILPASQLPKMADRSKRLLWSTFTDKIWLWLPKKTYPVTVLRPEMVEFWLWCLNRGNLILRIRKRCF